MLIISRKKDQKIIVADEIEITILEVGRNRVRFGIKAPKHVAIQTRLKTTAEADPLVRSETEQMSLSAQPSNPDQVTGAVLGFARRR